MTTITQVIAGLTDPPDPATDTGDTYSDKASLTMTELKTMGDEINTWRGQANTVASEVNANAAAAALSESNASDSETAAAASANFQGSWSALTGALAPPAAVYHDGRIWNLLVSIADVTASEPTGANSDWAVLSQNYRITRTSNTIITVGDFGQIFDWTSGTFGQTFSPSADLGNGFFCYGVNSGTGIITLTPNGLETINITAVYPGDIVLILSDGSNLYAYLLNKNSKTSKVVLRGGDGFGSTNTAVRKYTSVEENAGTAITYASTAAAGASLTINEPGLYEICVIDGGTGVGTYYVGASVNSAQLTTSVQSITAADAVGYISVYDGGGAGIFGCVSRTVDLAAGDVVRPHMGASLPSATSGALFSIVKVG